MRVASRVACWVDASLQLLRGHEKSRNGRVSAQKLVIWHFYCIWQMYLSVKDWKFKKQNKKVVLHHRVLRSTDLYSVTKWKGFSLLVCKMRLIIPTSKTCFRNYLMINNILGYLICACLCVLLLVLSNLIFTTTLNPHFFWDLDKLRDLTEVKPIVVCKWDLNRSWHSFKKKFFFNLHK